MAFVMEELKLKLDLIAEDARAYAASRGILMGSKIDHHLLRVAPVSLFPCIVSKQAFQEVVDVATIYAELYHNISRDPQFLKTSLSHVTTSDDFTKRLMDIYLKHKNSPFDIEFCIFRSDYMIHSETFPVFKQVEFNTISSGFGALSCRVSDFHRFVLEKHSNQSPEFIKEHLPQNNALKGVVSAMAKAISIFKETYGVNEQVVVLMVVQKIEMNFVDQRSIEFFLWELYKVKMIRKTLSEVVNSGKVDSSGILRIGSDWIGLVYFRAGYTPSDYNSEEDWEGRDLLERSCAIKCPSIAMHLAGTKRIQQQLCSPAIVSTFIGASKTEQLLKTCAQIWNFEDEGIDAAIRSAIENPQGFVLKPQREGGGNNIYGEKMKEMLIEKSKQNLKAYILMERFWPPSKMSALLIDGNVISKECLSEFGIFSAFIGNSKKILHNEQIGHLVRTKLKELDEGGVSAGFAVIDSPFLI